MTQDPLIARVESKMRKTGANQSTVASDCGLSQPHISKVLRGKIRLADKTAAKLESWLTSERAEAPSPALSRIARKLESLTPERRMQFMHLLAAIDRLMETQL
jgi:transcriptional regulator with XRE-family HTH domain